jgi:hypothetical protein
MNEQIEVQPGVQGRTNTNVGEFMKMRVIGIVIIALVLGAFGSADGRSSLENDAFTFANPFFAGRVITCESRVFTFFSIYHGDPKDALLEELPSSKYQIFEETLSTADKLNGVDFRGSVFIQGDAMRTFSGHGKWGEWQSVRVIPNRPLWGSIFVHVEHRNGRWNRIDEEADVTHRIDTQFDCALVRSIEDGRVLTLADR